ncbi:MAG: TetR family transcriptional regulator C-terminal domain-containing protein [Gammaproteobacteria bacterium]|nr:TetR family transcriptional regulator C-terminal domain-containing protein [Gammaproteobacteria bacterium]
MQQDTTERPGRRQLTRELRRQQLIDATVKCISKKGIGGTTLADVAREAGLSQGIVNLHFESKDNLLAETLRFLAEEYDEHFMRTLGKAPDHPAARLQAIMEMDLMPAVCDRHKLAVWFAFWGEVQAVPTYQKICAARDEKYDEIMIGLTDAVIEEGGYEGVDAQVVVDALSSMTDGMWLSFLINPKRFSRVAARRAVRSYLSATFPRHYEKDGEPD